MENRLFFVGHGGAHFPPASAVVLLRTYVKKDIDKLSSDQERDLMRDHEPSVNLISVIIARYISINHKTSNSTKKSILFFRILSFLFSILVVGFYPFLIFHV